MTQLTQSNYPQERFDGVLDQIGELGERTGAIAAEVGETIKQHPYATLAIVAGLAFAVGALWKMQPRPQSRLDALLARLPELSSENLLRRRWR